MTSHPVLKIYKSCISQYTAVFKSIEFIPCTYFVTFILEMGRTDVTLITPVYPPLKSLHIVTRISFNFRDRFIAGCEVIPDYGYCYRNSEF